MVRPACRFALLCTVAWASTCFLPLSRPPPNQRMPLRPARATDTAQGLLGPHELAKQAWRNKYGIQWMVLFSVAGCFCIALEKQFTGELTQYCFLAGNRAEFWPRMRKVLLILLLSPVCQGAYNLLCKKTSNSIKLSLQTQAFGLVLKSTQGLSEGAAAALFSQEIDGLRSILNEFLRGLVGCVIFSGFIAWQLVNRREVHFRQVYLALMCVLVVGVVCSLKVQAKVGPAGATVTEASRQVANGVVAELGVAEETRAYNATKERSLKLAADMQDGIDKEFAPEVLRQQWQMLDSWRQSVNFVAAYFLIGRQVMRGQVPFAA
ncbi:unnamed protein product [Durusdinium trenchii]|uniref:Uncharacterized protein n=1 Tax=Durusdinium trenchii TaxID=1381693 RepID=A0ABP0IRX3_9DINO